VIAFMPGQYAAQMHPGMQLVMRLTGYDGSYQALRIDRVGTEIIGPQEALRYAGRESAAVFSFAGPVSIVTSPLRSPKFTMDGHLYDYHDGMVGDTEVSVRSSRMISTLIPGLKRVFAQ
jgi:hypothetical protein